ncbi:tetratricopeptide repeat-containing sensor histidine kinase [Niabella beijingensis]|uniref:tetratricopeptide repeat-containing sensor histidine kinase n=1 Tax=Niabella beijingensis TaxID=2872700 RepID=UPI001CBA99A5|nr:ATP-binding protein [Niabella beijingensis]
MPSATIADYKKGEAFYNKQNDSAFYYFNKATTSSPDSLIPKAYTYMAIIQSQAGDYFGAQESLLNSMNNLKGLDSIDRLLVSNYNEFGRTNSNLKNYDRAIYYYDQALKYIKDDRTRITALNNKGVNYQKKKQYAQAIAIYQSILEQTKNNKNKYAQVLSNMAYAKWLQDSSYPAAPDLLHALQIRKDEKNDWGLNASYAHLSDYYAHTQPGLALTYAEKMYSVAQQLSSPDDEQEALLKLIPLSPPEAVKKYFTRYQHLNDSLQTTRNNAKNQFALIRFDAEKSKTDNLILQKDNAEKKVQIIRQWIVLFCTILLAAILFFWYRKRKQRLIREQQLKTSQKVHDVVANGLYRVISKIEHDKTGGKEQLLDDMSILYEQSRNISYEPVPENAARSFHESLSELLSSFGSDSTRVLITGNSKELWEHIKSTARKELKHILQELMVNMKKHSRAENVVIKFTRQEKQLTIDYTDDGIGLSPDFRYGNGLRNTETRIMNIGGTIIFNAKTSKGMKIQLTIPIA